MAIVTFRIRRDTAGNWSTVNPVLGLGEPGLETDTRKVKYGDGVTAWNLLGYAVASVSVTWGSITGLISAQTDLQTALDAKLAKASNLSDLPNKSAARANLRSSCRATISASLTGVDLSAGYTIPFNTTTWDDSGWHSNTVNPERMTVPAGLSIDRVEVIAGLRLTGLTASVQTLVQILKNGTTVIAAVNFFTSTTTQLISLAGADTCVAGDYYTVKATQAGGTTSGTVATATSVQFVIKAV